MSAKKTWYPLLANLSNCTADQIEALRFALKHPDKIEELNNLSQEELVASKSVGAVSILYHVMSLLVLGIIEIRKQAKCRLFTDC